MFGGAFMKENPFNRGMTNAPTTDLANYTPPVRDAELAVATRDGMGESWHRGTVVVLSPNGQVVLELGQVHRPIFARATLNPLHVIGALKAGAPLRGAQVAIACASHRGTFEQMRQVQGILTAAGLTPDNLNCPRSYPTDHDARDAMVRSNRVKTPLAYCCSGKHAGFLWACAAKYDRGDLEADSAEWAIENYLEPNHPLQRTVAEEVEEFTGEKIAHISIDECGAPVYALSPVGLARAYSTLGAAIRNLRADARASTVATAMVDYPELVQGPGAPDTIISEQLDAVVKSGAEGVLCIGLRSGASVAVKIADGAQRATYPVALRALQAAGYLAPATVDKLLAEVVPPFTGGLADGKPRTVGEVVPGSDLAAILAGVKPPTPPNNRHHGEQGQASTGQLEQVNPETDRLSDSAPDEPQRQGTHHGQIRIKNALLRGRHRKSRGG